MLRVSKKILVDYVSITPSRIELQSGKTYELPIAPGTFINPDIQNITDVCNFNVNVVPAEADKKTLTWSSSDNSVMRVNYAWHNGQQYYTLTTLKDGSAKLYAYDDNDDGKRGECTVTTTGFSVEKVTLDCTAKTISIYDDDEHLTATVYPETALNKNVTWSSSNERVVKVYKDGELLPFAANNEGIDITVTTEDGNHSATCKVKVDPREKVIVKKDSHSFYVEFADGKVWKNIGIDLSNRQENYNQLNPPDMWYVHYDSLIVEEQRYFDNIYVEVNGAMELGTYSVNQIAYLYLLDPLGIEYYMRNHACHDKDIMSGEFLTFKDEVYEAIFGNSERLSGRFYFTIVDGNPQYERYPDCNRMDVYSNAEVLFGSHTTFNFDALMNHILMEVFTNFIPGYSYIQLGVKLCQAMFFSGAIVGTGTSAAANLLTDYVENEIQSVVYSLLGWVGKYLDCLNTITNIIDVSFDTMNSSDINIFIKADENTYYRTVFDTPSLKVTINELLQKHNT